MENPKIRLRICFAPGKESLKVVPSVAAAASTSTSTKRSAEEAGVAAVDDNDSSDTDSEVEFMPRRPLAGFAGVKKRAPAHISKKRKTDNKATMATATAAATATTAVAAATDNIKLIQPAMARKSRIVNPADPGDAALIAASTKASDDIYMSDTATDERTTDPNKPSLYKRVVWGPEATDVDYPGSEFPTDPAFTQFVPGRWERLPDGTLRDQKAKLVVKLTDKTGTKRIFLNPPPRDWDDQEAITALNKRTVQQIRRNTAVRFRGVVKAYVDEERQWILNNLKDGKTPAGWKAFVKDFNAQFAGKTLAGVDGVRPERTHSSLTKEVERFGPAFYSKGNLPVAGGKKKSKSK